MKERPILFSAPMVRAILEGRKTQTRRIVKPQPDEFMKALDGGKWMWVHDSDERYLNFDTGFCPYGQPGDRLWVRETWGIADEWLHDCETDPPRTIAYRANLAARNFDPVYDVDTSDWGGWERMKWKPSIHMPRWASRITLEITGVRVERLHDISREDCIAEGIERVSDADHFAWKDYTGNGQLLSPNFSYQSLWESINCPGSWDANPWVWVINFKLVQQ